MGRRLGHGVSILANLVNPEVIVLGGYFVAAGAVAAAGGRDGTDRTHRRPARGRLPAGGLDAGPGAAAVGGAARVLDDVDAGHLPSPKAKAGA